VGNECNLVAAYFRRKAEEEVLCWSDHERPVWAFAGGARRSQLVASRLGIEIEQFCGLLNRNARFDFFEVDERHCGLLMCGELTARNHTTC